MLCLGAVWREAIPRSGEPRPQEAMVGEPVLATWPNAPCSVLREGIGPGLLHNGIAEGVSAWFSSIPLPAGGAAATKPLRPRLEAPSGPRQGGRSVGRFRCCWSSLTWSGDGQLRRSSRRSCGSGLTAPRKFCGSSGSCREKRRRHPRPGVAPRCSVGKREALAPHPSLGARPPGRRRSPPLPETQHRSDRSRRRPAPKGRAAIEH
jgi:hypothetical protein